MHVSRAKRIVATLLALAAGTTLVALLLTAGFVVLSAGSGADPAQAFSEIPVVPAQLDDLVTWLPDRLLAREVEPNTRAFIESTWVSGLQELALAQQSGDQQFLDAWFMPNLAQHVGVSASSDSAAWLTQYGHRFEVGFYSLDGSIMALTIDSDLERRFETGPGLRSQERFEVTFLLSDGRWRVVHALLLSEAPH